MQNICAVYTFERTKQQSFGVRNIQQFHALFHEYGIKLITERQGKLKKAINKLITWNESCIQTLQNDNNQRIVDI